MFLFILPPWLNTSIEMVSKLFTDSLLLFFFFSCDSFFVFLLAERSHEVAKDAINKEISDSKILHHVSFVVIVVKLTKMLKPFTTLKPMSTEMKGFM